MSLRLGDIAPNFQQASSEGEIDFYQFLGDSLGVLFSHPAVYSMLRRKLCRSFFTSW